MSSQYNTEKLLSIVYPIIIALSLVCSVCTAVVWNHWRYVLDRCNLETRNCGCILFGRSTTAEFEGGHAAFCYWSMYGLLIPLFFALILGIFHVFRVCMGKGKSRMETRTVKQRTGDTIIMSSRTELTNDSVSPYYWIPSAVISVFFLLFTLVHAIIFTAGFHRTCHQYRLELIKLINANGNQVAAIQGRLACSAIFDFMDYLHSVYSPIQRRDDIINTAAALYIAIISSWICVILWIFTTILNIKQARSERSVRV